MQLQVEQMQREAENKARATDQNARITAELARRTAEKERHERFVQKVHKESEARRPARRALPRDATVVHLASHVNNPPSPADPMICCFGQELRELSAKLAAAETTYERKLQMDEKAMLSSREAQYKCAPLRRLPPASI